MTSPLAAIHLLIGDQVGRYHFPDAGLGALAADVAVVLPGGGAVLRMLPHGSELPSSSRFTAGVRLDAIFGGLGDSRRVQEMSCVWRWVTWWFC
jgi:hypothetical protein